MPPNTRASAISNTAAERLVNERVRRADVRGDRECYFVAKLCGEGVAKNECTNNSSIR